jgi:hypothetical protein
MFENAALGYVRLFCPSYYNAAHDALDDAYRSEAVGDLTMTLRSFVGLALACLGLSLAPVIAMLWHALAG